VPHPTGLAVLVLGLGNTAAGPFALPLDLTFAGMPGCLLRVSSEGLRLADPGSGFAYVSIPAEGALVDLVFHVQALLFDAAANPAGLVLSDAATLVVGR
jgi:hypothetical protein